MYAPVRRFIPPPEPLVVGDIDDWHICRNSTINFYPTVTGGYPPYSYKWYKNDVEILNSNHATYTTQSADATPGTTNVYKLEVTDQSLNVASNEFYVYVNSALTAGDITGGNVSVNIGETYQLSVNVITGSSPYTYRWESSYNGISWFVADGTYNQSTYQADISDTGTTYYRVKITDSCGSNVTKGPVTINVVEPLTIDDISPTQMCPGDVVLIAPNIHGGVEPYSYQWYKDNTLLQGENDEFYQTLQADSTPGSTNNYKIVVTDGVGTTANNTFITFVANALSVSVVDPMRTIMPGWTTNIRPSVSGGRTPYTRKWYKDNDNTTVIYTGQGYTTPSADAVAGQIHTYRMVVTDACRNTAQVICTVQTADNLSVSLPNDITTQPNRAYFLEAEVTGGIAPYTYQWYKNDTAIQGETTSIYTTSNADAVSGTSNTYKLIVTDSQGNTAYDQCTITCT